MNSAKPSGTNSRRFSAPVNTPRASFKRAQILLAADAGATDEDIAISVGGGGSTVYRTKRRFVLGNLEAAISEEPRPGAGRKLSGKESLAGGDRLFGAARRTCPKWMFTIDKARTKMGRAYPCQTDIRGPKLKES